MTNRLANATSPYLLQHRDNPVDWWEWTDEAFAEARRRQVPVLLSVGYAACHWCHVMAHESFEDETVAQVLNQGYVSIKVDREERPDIDAIYMTATTAMPGRGGWPMTGILTPTAEPFFAGTYFPKAQFLQLLAAVTEAWTERREEVLASGTHVAEQLRTAVQKGAPAAIGDEVLDQAVTRLATAFDSRHGGFGGAPKFPPSMVLELLLRHHARARDGRSLQMADATCEAMARGGMYAQPAGGFARYSVDAAWVVPHFEKMLYDNAQLLRVYVHFARRTGNPLARKVVDETAQFMIGELGADGMFTSSLDADADGQEGLTYVWTPSQLREVLGGDDSRWAAALFNVTEEGTFEHGSSVLQLPVDPDDPIRFERIRGRLLIARLTRPQPGRDDKVVTAWNGLAITALAEASVALGRTGFL